jgi:hypothetical protein
MPIESMLHPCNHSLKNLWAVGALKGISCCPHDEINALSVRCKMGIFGVLLTVLIGLAIPSGAGILGVRAGGSARLCRLYCGVCRLSRPVDYWPPVFSL